MKSCLLALVLLIGGTASQALALSDAGPLLQDYLGGHYLTCVEPKGDPEKYVVKVESGRIYVFAKDSREAKFDAYGAIVNSTNIVIAMRNDVDGPLATNVLVLPLKGLAKLSAEFNDGNVGSTKAFEAYREGYDGTHGTYAVTCYLSP